MRLAYSLVGVLSAIVRFAGAFHLLKYCLVGTFADIVEWVTTSLDHGSYSRGYTLGGLFLPVVCILGIYSILEFVISIASFFLSKKPDYKAWTVLYGVNSVFMFLASLMSRGCIVWAKKINYIKFENDQIPYVWAALGVLFLMIMSVIAVFNTLRMKKAESK